jgi:phosphohistidine phosphatase
MPIIGHKRHIVQRLFLIRHAKSSWAEADVDDFHRPLNKRGLQDAPRMAERLKIAGIVPDIIISSPALRAKTTAEFMAIGTGYEKSALLYDPELYLGTLDYHCFVLQKQFKKAETIFLVGHNETLSLLAGYLSGRTLGNVPTCGIVALEYRKPNGFDTKIGSGHLVFFWFPKDGER